MRLDMTLERSWLTTTTLIYTYIDARGVFFRISDVVTLVFTGHDKREWASPRVIFDRIRLS